MKVSIKRRINLGFGMALLMLLVVGAASYRSIDELVRARDRAAQSRDNVEALSTVFSDIQGTETSQRGYVITGDDRYLESYDAARASLDGNLRRLEASGPGSPQQRQPMRILEGLVAAKLDELNRTIAIRRTQGFEAASRVVDARVGGDFMNQIRNLTGSMEAQERETQKQQEDQVRNDAQNAGLIIAVSMLLAFTVVPLSSILIHREIVRREQVEEALLFAKEEAERASRFKDQFLSTMSHELRTPLNAVLGFSDLLKEERYGSLNERQKRYVDHIHSGGDHLLKLINDVLDLSKTEAGRMEIVLEDANLEEVLGEVVNSLRPLAEAKRQDILQSAAPELDVRADATRLKQILMNLLANAIKFTPEGGRIDLVAERINSSVKISVRDNGPGIPLAQQRRIFEGFYRLPGIGKSIEGTGLGLAITRRLVALHGGKLDLESKPGAGSSFSFTLPLVRHPQRKGKANQSKKGGPGLILVIEDEPVSADLIQSHLRSSGYEIALCKESQLALAMAAELKPQAITLDILMNPVMGWDLLVNLRNDERTCDIPIVVVTIVDQRSLGTTLGADEYLVKPVDKASLLAALDRCLGNHRFPSSPGRVLVVEDDTRTREVLVELLTEQGHQVTCAADGEQAREKIQETLLPELVVLDLILPKVSGFELLAEWRASSRTSDLPIFVLTSKDLSAEEESYLRAHTELLVQKQVHWKDTLVVQVQRQIRRQIQLPDHRLTHDSNTSRTGLT